MSWSGRQVRDGGIRSEEGLSGYRFEFVTPHDNRSAKSCGLCAEASHERVAVKLVYDEVTSCEGRQHFRVGTADKRHELNVDAASLDLLNGFLNEWSTLFRWSRQCAPDPGYAA